MKLKYLGTAAAEAIPGMFCDCEVCRNALKVRGKEIKTRSQALLDDKILIDFPPDTYLHVINYGLDLRRIHHCIITHSHFDHLNADDFWCRFEGIAHGVGDEPLHVYLTEAGYRKTEAVLGGGVNSPRLKFHIVRPFEPFMIEDYRVTPLAANHDKKADPVVYVIERDGKAMFYANDTGILPEESWEYLSKMDIRLDFVSLDCTGMLLEGWINSHMSLDTNKIFMDKLEAMGRVDESTVIYVNHFSHNGLATHEQLVVEAGKYGYGVSFDGLEVEI